MKILTFKNSLMLGVFSVSFPLPVHAYIVLCIFDSHKLFEHPLCEFWVFG